MRAEPIKLTSFEDEGRAIVEKAKVAAKWILEKALGESRQIREKARQEGLQEAREAAAVAEKERVVKETAGLADLLQNVAKGVESTRAELVAEGEKDLVRLALRVAGLIVKREVKNKESVAVENLNHAVQLTVDRHTLEILLNPKDAKLVEKYLPKLRKSFLDIAQVHISADEDVAPGGCTVITKSGAVDADIKTQLEEIERQLLG